MASEVECFEESMRMGSGLLGGKGKVELANVKKMQKKFSRRSGIEREKRCRKRQELSLRVTSGSRTNERATEKCTDEMEFGAELDIEGGKGSFGIVKRRWKRGLG